MYHSTPEILRFHPKSFLEGKILKTKKPSSLEGAGGEPTAGDAGEGRAPAGGDQHSGHPRPEAPQQREKARAGDCRATGPICRKSATKI